MKKKLIENPIKKYARQMLREGEIDNAESALAAKDQVDRLQDMVEELSKMGNDELPKLVDKIRGSFGGDKATAYQESAGSLLTDLLGVVKEKKAALEQAVLVLTGDAQADPLAKTDMNLPDEDEEAEIPADGEEDLDGDVDGAAMNPLGREMRLPAEESRMFNKKLNDAKIVALKKALDETNVKKTPLKARRLAEELNRLAIIGIKEEAKSKKKEKDADNVKKSSKKMMKPVSEDKKKKEDVCNTKGCNNKATSNGHGGNYCSKCFSKKSKEK